MSVHPMWGKYPTLYTELTSVLDLMEHSIQISNKDISTAILTMINAGGKLLRPAYLLLFSQFGSQNDPEKVTALAASLEMLHTASLIHDDVVDESTLRRGLPTIQAHFDKKTAVYAGDYLFVCCFKLLSTYASSLKSVQLNVSGMEKILTGEMGQMASLYNTNMTVKQYLQNISGKTAELFALSCFIGAYENGTSEAFAKKCGKIGENIGIAFQILDDILDYTQQADNIGKPVLLDVRNGVYSLPLIYALQKDAPALLPYLQKKEQMTDEDVRMVHSLVRKLGGVAQAEEAAQKYTDTALQAIRKLPKNGGNTKQLLLAITQELVTRKN